ncbi:hypothetical protein F5Y04DRAFT_251850 [Hypomontagnella monticulosa]|nr:hypothetical protein F5Y04DRAFT_251850 [Hypomontagnella monticulosa]
MTRYTTGDNKKKRDWSTRAAQITIMNSVQSHLSASDQSFLLLFCLLMCCILHFQPNWWSINHSSVVKGPDILNDDDKQGSQYPHGKKEIRPYMMAAKQGRNLIFRMVLSLVLIYFLMTSPGLLTQSEKYDRLSVFNAGTRPEASWNEVICISRHRVS